ncbi:BspA family leucine-rich repeat surface protein [Aliifodinibius salipaludis]|nr:BspA family leucine-rich repeat surface protein [Aliifodinibius salipaludis]
MYKSRVVQTILISCIALILLSCGGDDEPSPTGGGEPTFYDVSVNVNPSGAGTISPSVDDTYEEGKEVELQANPGDEYVFASWTGDLEETDNPLLLTVDKNYELTANFELKTYELLVSTEGEGAVSETVIQEKSKEYEHGTVVELAATPAEGWRFVEWQGDITGSDNPKQITVNSPKEVTAVFEKKSYPLTILTDGEGAVSETVIQQKTADYDHGTVVELEPSAATGWEFVGWKGDLTGSQTPIQITVTQSTTIIAEFELLGSGSRPDFYLAENGVTIKCEAASVGDTGTVDGEEYTKRIAGDITTGNAPTTCTSGIMTMRTMFRDSTAFNGDISHWDVSSVIDMSLMFYNASSFNQDIGDWDVSSVGNMSQMFQYAASFNQNIGDWDVSGVEEMGWMFRDTDAFNQDIGGWDVSNVTDMRLMFYNASSFNQDIGDWDVSSVTNMYAMFQGPFSGTSSFNADISDWDVSGVENMGKMFQNADTFNQDISGWDVSGVTNMSGMFSGASAFNQDIGSWDVSAVTTMGAMFNNASSFNQDLSGWCVSNISSEPTNFSAGSLLTNSNKPVWGTCP